MAFSVPNTGSGGLIGIFADVFVTVCISGIFARKWFYECPQTIKLFPKLPHSD
jgi:hypothetical protein